MLRRSFGKQDVKKGRCTFDYSNDDGIVAIGDGEALFETRWSRAGGDSIHAYNDPATIDAIALATGANQISDVRDAARFDYSSRSRTPREGQVLLLRNVQGLYAALADNAYKGPYAHM